MNEADLGQFIMLVFGPFIPDVASGVIALILTLLLILLVRKFLPEQLEL